MVIVFLFPSVMCAEVLPARKRPDICLLMVWSEWIPYFAWLMCTAFAFPIKLLLSGSTSLLAFPLFAPCPVGEGSGQAAGWVFGCWLESTHHNTISNSLYRVWRNSCTEQTFESPSALAAKWVSFKMYFDLRKIKSMNFLKSHFYGIL